MKILLTLMGNQNVHKGPYITKTNGGPNCTSKNKDLSPTLMGNLPSNQNRRIQIYHHCSWETYQPTKKVTLLAMTGGHQ